MTSQSNPTINKFAAGLLILALAAIIFQVMANSGHYKERKRAVKYAYRHDTPHPMLIWRPKFHAFYARGLMEIAASPHTKFWLVSQDLDVMMMMNYFAYPKELRASLETQKKLETAHYADDYRPFTQLPPKGPYDAEIYTHFRESTFD